MRPMSKRKADIELNQDNWDAELEEQKETGTFQRAEPNSLTTRKILSVKSRRSVTQGTSGLFKSFTGLSDSPQPGEVRFNFGSNAGLGVNSVTPSNNTTESNESGKNLENETEYLKQLQILNQNLLDWISKHIKDDPHCILSPVFRDYEKHLKTLRDKFDFDNTEKSGVISTQANPPTTTLSSSSNGFTPPTSLTFAKPAENIPKPIENKTISLPSLLSGGTSSSDSGTTKPAFSFSFPPISSSGSQPPLFKFGSSISSAPPLTPATNTPTASANVADEEDEEYQPPKPVVREIKEEGSVYSIKCKLFYKLDTEWKDRGVGNLFIKPVSDEKFQLLVRADTNLGNILLNVLITKEIPVKLQKNNLTLVCVPSPPLPQSKQAGDDGNPKPIPMLLRVKSEESASELLKKFDQYRGITTLD